MTWPVNDFYSYAPDDESQGILFYIGTEPNLKWRTFSRLMLNVAQEQGVDMVVSLGALLDAVPHTREPRVTGVASSPELRQKVEWLGIRNSRYQGPTGIHSAFLRACTDSGLKHASLWGHSPHYVNTRPNPRVSVALLEKLRTLVEFDVGLDELEEAGVTFEAEVTKLISKQEEMVGYIRQLEKRYDKRFAPTGEIPSPEAMVEELEEFLKSQREGSDRAEEV